MQHNPHHTIRTILIIAAIVNLIALFLFEYGLPAPEIRASENSESGMTSFTSDTASAAGSDESAAISTSENSAAFLTGSETASEDTSGLAASEEPSGHTASGTGSAASSTEESAAEEENEDPDAPVLRLTESEVTLSVGDSFQYMNYIATMEDSDGSSLDRYVNLLGDVDTYTPGTYDVTYTITSPVTGKSTSRTLEVTVQ